MLPKKTCVPSLALLVVVAACQTKEIPDGEYTGSGASGGSSGTASGGGGMTSGSAGQATGGASGMAATTSGGSGGAMTTGGAGGASGGSSGAGAAAGSGMGAAAGTGGGSSGMGGTGGTSGTGAGGMNVAGAGTAGTGTAGMSSGGGAGFVGDGCTPGQLAETGELMGRFDTLQPMIGGQEYFMQVNEWNSSGAQVMAYGGDFFFKMTTQMASTSTNGGPTGFPSMFIGANSRHTTANSNMPKQVSALSTVPTTWVWHDNGTLADQTANIYNATYDVWFSTKAEGEPTMSGPSGGYLMVWLHDPPSAEPIGGMPMYEAVTIPGVSGTWDVWIGPNGNRPCISYVRTETALSLSFDLNAFIKDAVQNRPDTIQSAWYLTNVFTGFEIWSGGQGLESTAFCAVVN